jgi:hypothetical protein
MLNPIPAKLSTPRWIAGDSLKAGAYQFIPLPFVDDWLTSRQRKGMVRAALAAGGFSFDPQVPRLLAGGSRSLTARLGSFAKGLVLKPLRKVFRTVFFWLSARSAARMVVETYFLGRFLHHPALKPRNGTHLTVSDGRRLAAVFREVSKNIDLKAARDLVGKVARLVTRTRRRSAAVTSEELRGVIEEEAPGFVESFDRLVSRKLAESHRAGA